jgi:endonuclease YncB( thermonuclease family)
MSPVPAFLRCLLLSALLGPWPAAASAEIAGTPRVIDGATIEVAGQRVRLWGIVAPTPGQVCRGEHRAFDCSAVARSQLQDLTAGTDVVCEEVEGAATPPGEIVGRCVAGGFSINRNMVYTGWAFADPAAGELYGAVEDEAREAKRGLWRWDLAPPERAADGG